MGFLKSKKNEQQSLETEPSAESIPPTDEEYIENTQEELLVQTPKQNKTKIIKDNVVHFFYKIKFVDKRIFLWTGIFIMIALFALFALSLFYTPFSQSETIEESEDDFFNNGGLGGSLLETPNKTTNKQKEEDIPEVTNDKKEVSPDDLVDDLRARLGVGEKTEFEIDSFKHEILVNDINGESVGVTIRSDPIFSTLTLNTPKKFDLERDGKYDLTIELLEIVNKEGILLIKRINEEYELDITKIVAEAPVEEPVDGFVLSHEERVPYSCTEQDGYIDYSQLVIKKEGDFILSKKEIKSVFEDECNSGYSYEVYSCDGNEFVITQIDCNSRYEECIEGNAKCEVVKWEKNIGISGSPDQSSSSINECHLAIGDTLFWTETSKQNCQDLFVASKFFSEIEFVEFLDFFDFDLSAIESKMNQPHNIEISYISTVEDVENFDETYSKFNSDKCESINFLGVDLYCFNYISSLKSDNIESAMKLLIFSNKISFSYSSLYQNLAPFNFILNKNIQYIDGTVPSVYGGDLSGQSSGCSPGSRTANYKKINSKDNIFLCGGLLEGYPSQSDLIFYSALIYREALEVLSIPTTMCYADSLTEDCSITKTCQLCTDYSGWNELWFPDEIKRCALFDKYDSYDELNITTECTLSQKSSGNDGQFNCNSRCENEGETHSRIAPKTCTYYYSYNQFNSLHGEYVKYLHSMTIDNRLTSTYRSYFSLVYSSELSKFGCSNGIPPTYTFP